MTLKTFKEQGDVLYKAANFHGAIEYYGKAINNNSSSSNEDPEVYLAYSNRCACYLQLHEFQKALYDANACVRLKPLWPKGYNRKGSCLVRLNQIDEAIAAYERSVELDEYNTEAINALTKLRNTSPPDSSSGSEPPRTNYTNNNLINTFTNKAKELYQKFLTTDWSSLFSSVTAYLTVYYYQFIAWWNDLSADTRKYIQIGLGIALVYYFFFYRSSSPYDYDYYPQSSYSYGYNGGAGLSWPMWGAVMLGAYKIPPMLPDLLGEQYARPFFGMSWTTFMWLLNMLTSNRGGGRFMGGGYGGLGGRRGGMFGRRY